jgi:hypothetical protein
MLAAASDFKPSARDFQPSAAGAGDFQPCATLAASPATSNHETINISPGESPDPWAPPPPPGRAGHRDALVLDPAARINAEFALRALGAGDGA